MGGRSPFKKVSESPLTNEGYIYRYLSIMKKIPQPLLTLRQALQVHSSLGVPA